jgi:ubiquinone/menaquinone biosynthesis C-methylase UbiE
MVATRKQHVIAQYNTAEAAEEYARCYASPLQIDGRLRQERTTVVLDILADLPGGRLLDAGCGSGALTHSLLVSERHDYEVAALDQSPAMVSHCANNVPRPEKFHAYVGDLEALPFADGTFDVTIVNGALEYTRTRAAITEVSRVTRPGGVVITSMLNPISPYWITNWFLFAPALRALGAVERALGVRADRRHGSPRSGIWAVRPSDLRAMLRRAGLSRTELTYLTPTLLVPPLDRFPAVVRHADRATDAVARLGLAPLLATEYLVVSRRNA